MGLDRAERDGRVLLSLSQVRGRLGDPFLEDGPGVLEEVSQRRRRVSFDSPEPVQLL